MTYISIKIPAALFSVHVRQRSASSDAFNPWSSLRTASPPPVSFLSKSGIHRGLVRDTARLQAVFGNGAELDVTRFLCLVDNVVAVSAKLSQASWL